MYLHKENRELFRDAILLASQKWACDTNLMGVITGKSRIISFFSDKQKGKIPFAYEKVY